MSHREAEVQAILKTEIDFTKGGIMRNPKVLSHPFLPCVYSLERFFFPPLPCRELNCGLCTQSYWVWHHRRVVCGWLDDKNGHTNWKREVDLCTLFLERDARNCMLVVFDLLGVCIPRETTKQTTIKKRRKRS